MSEDLIAEATDCLRRWTSDEPSQDPAPRQYGAALAQRLRGAAIDLSCNKATEFSPDIRPLTLLAAKVAWLSFASGDPALSVYERDLFYYRATVPMIVADYERFKARYAALHPAS